MRPDCNLSAADAGGGQGVAIETLHRLVSNGLWPDVVEFTADAGYDAGNKWSQSPQVHRSFRFV